MKIIFDYQIFLKQSFGGPSRYFVELNKHLQYLNVDSKIISPIHINNHLSISKKSINIKLNNFYLSSALSRLNEHITSFYLKNKNKLIIHPTYYNFDYLFSNKNKKVITVFDLIHEKFYSQERVKKYKDEKFRALNQSDHIICISENTKRDLIDHYNVEESKIKVTYLATDVKKKKNFIRKDSSTKPFILYVGNRHDYKNFEIILKAFNANKEIKNNFLLFFFGGGDFSKNEIRLFKKNNFDSGQFRFLGNNEEILGSLYSSAFCLIYPSLYEGFGLPILEAMKNSCPVISSKTSSLPEVGGDAVEYFDPQEKDTLIEAINKIAHSESLRKTMINRGYERSKTFSWDKTALETKKVYDSLF